MKWFLNWLCAITHFVGPSVTFNSVVVDVWQRSTLVNSKLVCFDWHAILTDHRGKTQPCWLLGDRLLNDHSMSAGAVAAVMTTLHALVHPAEVATGLPEPRSSQRGLLVFFSSAAASREQWRRRSEWRDGRGAFGNSPTTTTWRKTELIALIVDVERGDWRRRGERRLATRRHVTSWEKKRGWIAEIVFQMYTCE